ncbi:MAG: hypothetical protein EHM18_12285 [Acidobacteria bacterium]|nr:MAG: hypothetical protein EHM18_12285 [Acidobacteriota bacterium]
MVFRKNWARTAVMLMLFTVFGYEVNLDGFISIISDALNGVVTVCTGKPIKIPPKKVARF